MINDSYDFIALGNKDYYYFESEGKQGNISKIVTFTRLKNKFWNLGFGDLQGQQINDSVISNNHDVVKLISTVAKIAYDFSERFPRRNIEITPVDEKRKNLYNHIFRRHYEVIQINFHIIGIHNSVAEDYSPEKNYDTFRLKRKFA